MSRLFYYEMLHSPLLEAIIHLRTCILSNFMQEWDKGIKSKSSDACLWLTGHIAGLRGPAKHAVSGYDV